MMYLCTIKSRFLLFETVRSHTFSTRTAPVLLYLTGATPATSVATARKGITVVGSFVVFPGDKPFSLWFGAGIVLFMCAIGLELKSRVEKKKR